MPTVVATDTQAARNRTNSMKRSLTWRDLRRASRSLTKFSGTTRILWAWESDGHLMTVPGYYCRVADAARPRGAKNRRGASPLLCRELD